MKNGLKRLTAMLLLVCLLASFVVPATFASSEDEVVRTYDFNLYNAEKDEGYNEIFGTSTYKYMSSTCACPWCTIFKRTVKTHIASKYDTLKWEYLESTTGDGNICLDGEQGRGLFVKDTNKNGWAAFQIHVPRSGSFALQLTTSYYQYAGSIQAYIFPASELGSGTVAELMASDISDNNVGAIEIPKTENVTKQFNAWNFEAAGDYIVVLGYANLARVYIGELALIGSATPSEEEVIDGTVYDFDLANPLTGIFNAYKTSVVDALDTIDERWTSGESNWNWEAASENLMGTTAATADQLNAASGYFYNDSGMRFYMSPDDWTAFRIKSPGSGTFTLSLKHLLGVNSGTLAVYILPGDTEDIYSAMDHANRVGKVALYNVDGDTTTDKTTSYLGYWEFEADKEYIVVIEAYVPSPYNSSYCYMNLYQLIAENGEVDYTSRDKDVMPIMVQEDVVPVTEAGMTALITQVGDHDYYIVPLEAGTCLVYDLDTKELVKKFEHGIALPDEIIQDEDGIVWISGPTTRLVRYDPVANTVSYTSKISKVSGLEHVTGIATMEAGNNGDIYLGCYGGATLAVYNDETKEYRVIGEMLEGGNEIHAMTRYGDYLYFAAVNKTTKEAVICKFNILTEKLEDTCDIAGCMTNFSASGFYPQSVNVLGEGDLLIVGGNSGKMVEPVVIDPATMELVETDLPTGLNLYVSAPYRGKQYFQLSNAAGMYHYDLETKTFGRTTGMPTTMGFRSKGSQLVTLDGKEYLMTFTNGVPAPLLYDFAKKSYSKLDNLVVHGGNGAYCRSLINGPEGSNELYYGAYNTDDCAVYNTETGTLSGYYQTGGQGDSALWYNGELYYGNYSSTTLNKISWDTLDASTPASNTVKQCWQLDHDESGQLRVHTLSAGDGYVFAGTIPNTAQYGGAVVVYNTSTGEWYYERNVVQDQAVIDVEYYDKLLFGSTSTDGGSKEEALDPTASAKIFVYDYKNKEVLATMDPRDYIDGIDITLRHIAGLTADPYVAGRFWAVVSETLFCFSFDKETKAFTVQEVLSFDKTTEATSASRTTNSREIKFNPETKQMYFSFDTNGGMQCIELVDFYAEVGSVQVAKTERLLTDWAQKYTLSEQGDLYYDHSSNGNLYMLPLNVTEEDWEIAEVVDQMILNLGKDITLESEAAIKAARAAYEALDWRYKALVQNLDFLQEREVELLERKIDVAVEKDVTADTTLPALKVLMDEYETMTERQQQYVKNYTELTRSFEEAVLYQENADAYAVQSQINDLTDVTLADEADVIAARAAYEALTDEKKELVSTEVLETAEDRIATLKQEVKDVNALINALNVTSVEDAASVYEARNAYNALSDEQKALVDEAHLDHLIGAEEALADLLVATDVQAMIDALPEDTTLADEDAITAARTAYDALTDEQKKLVQDADLIAAEEKLAELKAIAAAQRKINALPEVITLSDEDNIRIARNAYNALSDSAKAQVDAEKLISAEAQLAEIKAVNAVQEKIDALPDTVVLADKYLIKTARTAYDALADAQKAQVNAEKLISAEAQFAALKAETPATQTYDFELYSNPALIAANTELTYSETDGRIKVNFRGSDKYSSSATVADWICDNYIDAINWGIETSAGDAGTERDYQWRGVGAQGVRMFADTEGKYLTFRIHVPAAGLYTVSLNAGTSTSSPINLYIFEASTDYATEKTGKDTIAAAMVAENRLVEDYSMTTGAENTLGQWNFAEAGDYIVVFEAAQTQSDDITVRGMTLTPVINETTAVAKVGERYFLSMEEAFAHQIENGASCVALFKDVQIQDMTLESGAVLDLNGYTLTADAVNAAAPGASIVDSSENDTGVLVVNDADGYTISEDNAQLPMYDSQAGGYRFFQVDVQVVAVTGKGGANPKYWFKVSVENFEEMYALLQQDSEMLLKAKLAWGEAEEAEASADMTFTKEWAERYKANNGIYITVSVTGSESLENFTLIPCVAANGVAIKGDEMK